ncbi:hypothetical protein N9023_06845 [Opitutaceae bacterium]|nr:hypothetical protein [Opitutaceae bacterium]
MKPGGIGQLDDWILWFAAAIWGLHPLRVEPVAWVTGSTYPLSAFWLLLSFKLYLQAHRTRANRISVRLVGAWIAAVLAYSTYPVTVTYGLFLVVVDVGLLRCVPTWQGRDFYHWLLKIGAFLVPAVGAIGVTVYSRFGDTGIFSEAPDLESVGLGLRVLTSLAMVGALWGRLVWFADLTPNVAPIDLSISNLGGVVGLAGLSLGLSFWVWKNRSQRPGWATVWFGTLVLALPCLGLTERPTWLVDRYTYLVQLVAIAGISLGALASLSRSWKTKIGVIIGISSLAICVAISSRNLPMWSSSRALFASMTMHPNFPEQPVQSGHILMMWANYEAGELNVTRVNELRAQAFEIYRSGIKRALKMDDYAAALILMNQIQRHFPTTAEMRREKGAWLMGLGRDSEARLELEAALVMDPDVSRTVELLALLKNRKRDSSTSDSKPAPLVVGD